MRKFVKNNLIDLILTIDEANDAGLTADCNEGLSALSKSLKNCLPDDRYEKYRGLFSLDKLQLIYDLLLAEPVLIEIVFLPVKASMWDSLESVWEAARKDERAFVSVVPVPFMEYENGNVASRYEGNELPGYVTVTHYEDYDLSVVLPDIGYIHNAYDDGNNVYSVRKYFYTKNLKRYIEKLIYLPYYAHMERMSAGYASIFANCFADFQIAVSEKDASAVIEAGAPPETVVVLGSPKIDHMIGLDYFDKAKAALPKGWEALQGKTVFFLNSSINSLLKRSHFYISKLRKIFEVFEGRNDIGIVWRPHPMTIPTINAMRPEMIAAFNDLREYFNKFGIFDESPDFYDAFRFSDAFLGDGASSFNYLYGLTGKPMFVLDFTLPLDIEEDLYEKLCHSDLIDFSQYNSTLRSFPQYGRSLLCDAYYKIDIESATAQLIPLPNEQGADSPKTTLLKLPEFIEAFKQYIVNDDIDSLAGNVFYDSRYWFASPQGNMVVEFDSDSMKFFVHRVGPKGYYYASIAVLNDKFYLSRFRAHWVGGWDESIIEWDPTTEETVEHGNLPLHQSPLFYQSGGISTLFAVKGYLYAFPLCGDNILKIKPENFECEVFELTPSLDYFERKSPFYTMWENMALPQVMYIEDRHVFIAQLPFDYSLIIIDPDTGNYTRKKWKVSGAEALLSKPQRVLPEHWGKAWYNNLLSPPENLRNNWREAWNSNAKTFISKVVGKEFDDDDMKISRDWYRSHNVNSDGSCGEKVHSFAMGLV